jgi:hypothetical protein
LPVKITTRTQVFIRLEQQPDHSFFQERAARRPVLEMWGPLPPERHAFPLLGTGRRGIAPAFQLAPLDWSKGHFD